ncbi:DUF1049 domain-containing protein [Rhizobium alvei]|uniref:DUF1049 domain-containing protein n=1 Tax=Rhizobium alvei TaxID=1132659 RepID=A0ABT8YQ58_9HYPH|nr:DUF1049 domain-containing protein [Rhizobium alvei]MDO6965646.1 DUF1049 domain-containing protein [Rhizobium alvei]
MVMRLIKIVIIVPIAILLVVLSVANRHLVTLALNPFEPQDSVLSVSLPFFLFLFAALVVGMLIGSVATWFAQGKHRKRAKDEAHEARKWREEADRQRNKIEDATTQKLLSASSR